MLSVGDLVRGGPPMRYPGVVLGNDRWQIKVWRLDVSAPAILTPGGVQQITEADLTEREWAAYCAWKMISA
jgi:hypothetical protein